MPASLLTDLFLHALTAYPDAAVAILNAEADRDTLTVHRCLGAVFRARSRSDPSWMWQTLATASRREMNAIDPHIGTVAIGNASFPPHGMGWVAYAEALETAEAAYWDWPEASAEEALPAAAVWKDASGKVAAVKSLVPAEEPKVLSEMAPSGPREQPVSASNFTLRPKLKPVRRMVVQTGGLFG